MSFYCVRCRKRMTGLRVTISKKEERREEIAQCLDADDGSASMSKAVDQDYAKLIREGKLTGKILCASHVPSVKLVGRKIRNGSSSSKNKVAATTRVHKVFRQYAKTIQRKPANDEVFEDDAQSDLDEYCDLDDNDNCTEDNYEEQEQEQDEHEMYTPPTDSDSDTTDEERLYRDDPFFSTTRFIVTGSMLLKFAEQILSFDCPCARPKIVCTGRRVSTSATVQMECVGCRKPSKWNSQEPLFPEDRQKALNHELPIAATLTGVSYARFLSMCNILRIAVPSMSTRKRVMRQNGWNAIQNVFLADRLDSIRRVKDHYKEENDQVPKLHIEADGQFDSPGYSSLLCKVSLFETRTGLCLLSNTLDKRDEGSTSAGMELIGIKRGMEQLQSLGMSVKSLTTDKSSSVRKHMAVAHGPKSKKPIRHYYDFWHLAKNCNNKLRKAAKTKRNSPLVKWRQSIINYLYAVREQGNGDPVKIREFLLGMLYHVSGRHRWEKDTRFTHYKKCPHGRLARDKTFLSPKSQWICIQSPAGNHQ